MNIGLIVNRKKPGAADEIRRIAALCARFGSRLLLRQEDSPAPLPAHCTCVSEEDFLSDSEQLWALGGDGTMLKAATLALRRGLPLLGINLGRVGFLTAAERGDDKALTAVLKGDWRPEKRLLLRAEADGQQVNALNELCFTKDTLSKTPEFTLAADGCGLGDFRADSLLFATPTGSTAYTLSAGGPILAPEVAGFLMTPVCPIGTKTNSVVFGAGSLITLVPRIRPGSKALLLCDGKKAFELKNQTACQISVSPQTLTLIRLPQNRFFETCTKKIWKEDAR